MDKIDENLKVETSISEPDLVFHDVRKPPFALYGLYRPQTEPCFKRLPDDVAAATSANVQTLALHCSGGRVRLRTDSRFIAIQCKMKTVYRAPHFSMAGSCGFDLYIDHAGTSVFHKPFLPPYHMKNGYESIQYFKEKQPRFLTIHLPTYNDVSELYIGLERGASLEGGQKYINEKPVVFYGSSITQGACASRPGNTYPAIIAKLWGCDFLNLGFSGSAKGEEAIAAYMAGLPMSAFVCDYDHNAPTPEHLAATHEALYRTVRARQPHLPYLMISAPSLHADTAEDKMLRREIIYQTYRNAMRDGDTRVFFIDGETLFGKGAADRDLCTVDTTHPNDLGFRRMAEVIGGVLQKAMGW